MTSKEKIRYRQTVKWKRFRAELLDDCGRKCYICDGFKRKGLQIHHVNPKAYGHEKREDVVVLCPACHKELERLLRKKKLVFSWYQHKMKELYVKGKDEC